MDTAAVADGASAKTGAHLMIAVDISSPGIIRFHPANFVVTTCRLGARSGCRSSPSRLPQTTLSSLRLYGVFAPQQRRFSIKQRRRYHRRQAPGTYRGGLNGVFGG